MERQLMETDIVVAGFGPAAAGFLLTLAPELSKVKEDGTPLYESRVMPGMPLQVMCYERADDTGFGVSGIVTRAEAMRATFPGVDLAAEIPNAANVSQEKTAYLFDHLGCSKRSLGTRLIDGCFRMGKVIMKGGEWQARELPITPPFMDKRGGLVLNMGSLMGWAACKVMESGTAQIWPGSPVAGPIFDGERVVGVRMADQGVEKDGAQTDAYMPGMDVKARLTVVADGPVGAVGRALDERFGLPKGHARNDWGVGMKAVVQLPDSCKLEPGTIIHTLGFPEPEIFGFFYVHPNRTASMGIFVAPWQDTPVRTTYRYLQHWMQHPYIWRHIEGGTLVSWGAKSIQESGTEGEPFLCGDGFARIGEGSGTTDCLANAGVDEAWASGAMLARNVLKLLAEGRDFTKANLEGTYLAERRSSALDRRLKKATHARAGFNRSFFWGMAGEGLCGLTGGILNLGKVFKSVPPANRIPELSEAVKGRKCDMDALAKGVAEAKKARKPLHDAVMDACGWPEIPFDGKLLVTHQDALLIGGKVQAAPGFADHVRFADAGLCRACTKQTCIEICSAQALMPADEEGNPPKFDREKCVHCGACIWNCAKLQPGTEKSNVVFSAGSGGLHSNEN
ncbi:MAG: 4Fe-4S ferredoxin [Verrucomicrobiota bacterium]|nr:4Fe-4S ferredoxin [Verrucomicrobiota bacterium]MDY5597655.1 4Fe-4S ferredoxin [Kiritimatiellia bacterium]